MMMRKKSENILRSFWKAPFQSSDYSFIEYFLFLPYIWHIDDDE